jgi:hypothetical protein
MSSILELSLWVGGLAVAWWYLQIWPFDGSTGLPKRQSPPPIPKS